MEKYITVSELLSITILFEKKEKELSILFESLSFEDIKDVQNDNDFEQTVRILKNQILLRPIEFKQINILPKQHVQKRIPVKFDKDEYVIIEVYKVPVEFVFEGSTELFGYYYNEKIIDSKCSRFYLPHNEKLIVTIDPNKCDNAEIIKIANDKLELNYNIFKQINPVVSLWSEKMNSKIDELIRNKKNSLKNSSSGFRNN